MCFRHSGHDRESISRLDPPWGRGVFCIFFDYLVINSSGIFVIEVKNWEGRIKGDFDDAQWVQSKRGHRPLNLKNPIKQNTGHLHSFKRMYKGKMPVQSLVVMASNNKPQGIPGIWNYKELPQYFEQYKKYYSTQDIDAEYQKLLHLKDNISTNEHVKNIKTHRVVNKEAPKQKPMPRFYDDDDNPFFWK